MATRTETCGESTAEAGRLSREWIVVARSQAARRRVGAHDKLPVRASGTLTGIATGAVQREDRFLGPAAQQKKRASSAVGWVRSTRMDGRRSCSVRARTSNLESMAQERGDIVQEHIDTRDV